jgi:histidyl-tRNA synthetase
MGKGKSKRLTPRIPKGFRDIIAADIRAREKMIATIRQVYDLHGFEPLETPAMEYVEVLGKYLPESDTPMGGIFAQRDDDDLWIALRYDLTAPLSRFVALNQQTLPRPFRRYQIGPVYRQEKPGPGRFREFYQCDFDSVGAPSLAADAEVCSVLVSALEALGIERGDYRVRVNNRKVLTGVLETIEIKDDADQLNVLRAVDKLDRLGEPGVRLLLGEGRKDESGDFTKGAGLSTEQADVVMAFVRAGGGSRAEVCKRLNEIVGESEIGKQGVQELETIAELLDSMGLDDDQVPFDPSVVRGLAYYTGPVFEAELTFEVEGEDGEKQSFGSVAGGGRYDDLVERFTHQKMPATGASIGVDRLLAALQSLGKISTETAAGPVLVSTMEKTRLADYQKMVAELREAGIRAEMYMGTSGFKPQMKYADRRNSPVVIIAGGDEFANGEVTIKDMDLGAKLAADIDDNKEWRKGQPAQMTVARDQLVAKTREILLKSAEG